MALIDRKADCRVISPAEGQCFFGYYDLQAYDKGDRFHLCSRASFLDRLPEPEDSLELGVIDLREGNFHPFGETTLWNFQQGCMLQWYGSSEDEVCYNVRIGAGAGTCIHNLRTGVKRFADRPCACISQDGRYGLSVSFARIYDFRSGYGYAGLEDPFREEKRPENDGIYLVDLRTGRSRLLISLGECLRQFPIPGMEQAKFVVNHITFNPSANRFLFLLRNFPDSRNGEWSTTLITSDLEGNMYPLLRNTYVSHYCWKNDHQILAHCSPKKRKGLFLLDDCSDGFTELESPYFGDDIHCIYSPDRSYVLGDGYAVHDPYRPLFLYSTKTGKTELLLKAETIVPKDINIRCDLHARWNRNGDKISFDTTDRGRREICELDVSGLNF